MTIQLEFTSEIIKEIRYQRYNHLVPLVQRRMEALPFSRSSLQRRIREYACANILLLSAVSAAMNFSKFVSCRSKKDTNY